LNLRRVVSRVNEKVESGIDKPMHRHIILASRGRLSVRTENQEKANARG